MTNNNRPKTLIEHEEATPVGQREMAAARAEVRVSNLLKKALRLSGMSQRELAERLGVTEGRVSQVINSDGNLRITTVARYLRVMGYELHIDATAADPGVRALRSGRRSRRPAHSDEEPSVSGGAGLDRRAISAAGTAANS